MEPKKMEGATELSLDKLIAKAEEAPVVKLVDLIIRQAIDERASDIHIEPKRNVSLRPIEFFFLDSENPLEIKCYVSHIVGRFIITSCREQGV